MDAAPVPASSAGRRATGAVLGLVAALLAAALFRGGGSDADTLVWVGGCAVVGSAVLLVLALRGVLPLPRLDRPGLLVVGALAALSAWAALSLLWAISTEEPWDWLNRLLVYLAFLGLGVVVGALVDGVRGLALVLAALLGAVVGWALLGVAVPELFEDGDRIARLREPIGYWNALALLAGAAIPLGLWVATTGRRSARGAGALLVYASTLALLLTQSRAGVIAAVAVLVLWLWAGRRRLESGILALLAGVPAMLVAGWAFSRPALVEDAVGRAARDEDAPLFAALAVGGAAVVVALAVLVPITALASRHHSTVRRGLLGAAVVLVLAGAIGLVTSVGNPVSWAGNQVDGGECANDPNRFTELCDNNRLAWWGDALEVARDRPLTGTGAGTYSIARLAVREDATPVREPHSVPLQLLSDLGVVGLGLGLLLAVAAIVGVRRSLRRAGEPDHAAAVALVALPLAYAIHALVDYDADFLAVTAPMLVALGALLAHGRPRASRRGGIGSVLAVTALAVATLASLWLPELGRREVDRAYAAIDDDRLEAAAEHARRARQLDPLALAPLYAMADVAWSANDRERAAELLEQATERQPDDPEPWLALGRFHLAGDPPKLCQAYHALNEAYTLDPSSARWVQDGPLDVARDAVNAGACEQ